MAAKKVVVFPGDDAAPEAMAAAMEVPGAMMLEYLGFADAAARLERSVCTVYAHGKTLTPDQGGTARTDEFTRSVVANL